MSDLPICPDAPRKPYAQIDLDSVIDNSDYDSDTSYTPGHVADNGMGRDLLSSSPLSNLKIVFEVYTMDVPLLISIFERDGRVTEAQPQYTITRHELGWKVVVRVPDIFEFSE